MELVRVCTRFYKSFEREKIIETRFGLKIESRILGVFSVVKTDVKPKVYGVEPDWRVGGEE